MPRSRASSRPPSCRPARRRRRGLCSRRRRRRWRRSSMSRPRRSRPGRRSAASSRNRSGIGRAASFRPRATGCCRRPTASSGQWRLGAAYAILPLFAFSATGVSLAVDLSSPGAGSILWGVILGLVIGKPLGVSLASLLAIKARVAHGARRHNAAQFHRRRLPVRHRRHGGAADGGPGLSGRPRIGDRQDRRSRRLGPGRRARRRHSRFRPEGPRHYASAGILTQPRA